METKNILFDFDGTLMNTWPGIRNTLVATLDFMGLSPDPDAVTRQLVGMPLARVFDELLGGDGAAARLATVHYRGIFPEVGMPLAGPFEGVPEMLERLRKKGRSMFVVTARNEMITRQMIAENDLEDFFSSVRGEKDGEVPDGKGEMVNEVMGRFFLDPKTTVMVGDRRFDMEAASENGIRNIGVTYGYGSEKELIEAGAQSIANSVGELAAMLLKE